MSNVFPTLDALKPQLSKAVPATDWISHLASTPAPAVQAGGWTPPTLAATKLSDGPDLEALQKAAMESGFRAGYAEGKASGTALGHAEGLRAGREEGRKEVLAAQSDALTAFRQALSEVVEGVGPAVEAWKADVEARATELAMDAVRALLAAELQTRQPDAMGIVREALGHAEGALRATIRLSPFDRAALAERKEEILTACASLRDVELVDDRSLRSGCVIETENGVVDASLDTRLGLLEAA